MDADLLTFFHSYHQFQFSLNKTDPKKKASLLTGFTMGLLGAIFETFGLVRLIAGAPETFGLVGAIAGASTTLGLVGPIEGAPATLGLVREIAGASSTFGLEDASNGLIAASNDWSRMFE